MHDIEFAGVKSVDRGHALDAKAIAALESGTRLVDGQLVLSLPRRDELRFGLTNVRPHLRGCQRKLAGAENLRERYTEPIKVY